jgi:phosphoglycerate dehydrogenase-like enzyme
MLAHDPFVDGEVMAIWGVQKVDLAELLARSDFVSIHCPLTEESHHLIDSRAFGLMKEGVFVVNTSRGPIIEEAALANAVASGKVWGVGLDVFEQEPLPPDSPLRAFENLIFTPHVGANSEDSVDDLYRTGCEISIAVAQGRWPLGVVNPEVEGKARLSKSLGA